MATEGWEGSDVKEMRLERAAFWLGSVRRVESIAEGVMGCEGSGVGSRRALSAGGRRRDCHVWLSACNLFGWKD